MASEGGPQTSGDYITHHLQNLQACKNDAGEWIFGACPGELRAGLHDRRFRWLDERCHALDQRPAVDAETRILLQPPQPQLLARAGHGGSLSQPTRCLVVGFG